VAPYKNANFDTKNIKVFALNRWGRRKGFSDGKIMLAYKNFLGFKKGEDGKPEIVEEEAEIIRLI